MLSKIIVLIVLLPISIGIYFAIKTFLIIPPEVKIEDITFYKDGVQAINEQIIINTKDGDYKLDPSNLKFSKFSDTFPAPPTRKIPNEYSTEKLPSGEANILVKTTTSTEPQIIGRLTEKLDERRPCDSPGGGFFHPTLFLPSFNEEYLLSNSTGGGICYYIPAIVSRDGKYNYEIGNESYDKLLWVGDNKIMLIKTNPSTTSLITLNNDGSFTSELLDNNLNGFWLSERNFSSSRNFLFAHNKRSNEYLMYDTRSHIISKLDLNENATFYQGAVKWNVDGTGFYYTALDKVGKREEAHKFFYYDIESKQNTLLATKPPPKYGKGLFQLRFIKK